MDLEEKPNRFGNQFGPSTVGTHLYAQGSGAVPAGALGSQPRFPERPQASSLNRYISLLAERIKLAPPI